MSKGASKKTKERHANHERGGVTLFPAPEVHQRCTPVVRNARHTDVTRFLWNCQVRVLQRTDAAEAVLSGSIVGFDPSVSAASCCVELPTRPVATHPAHLESAKQCKIECAHGRYTW